MCKTTQYYVGIQSKFVCSPVRVSKNNLVLPNCKARYYYTILLCRLAKQDRKITRFKKEYNSLLRRSPEQRIIVIYFAFTFNNKKIII